MKHARTILSLDERHMAALRAAALSLQHAQAGGAPPATHRSLRELGGGRSAVALSVAFATTLTLAVWVAQPTVMAAWEDMVLWWARALHIPLEVTADDSVRRWTYRATTESLMPGTGTTLLTSLLVIAAAASTWWMEDRATPLKYLVRALCAVQASAILFFVIAPSRFPYMPQSHLTAMLESGYLLMLGVPLLLALGYIALDARPRHQLLAPLFLLAYFAIALPHKAVLHMLVLQHMSVLFMPLLYLCFGWVFDVMLFIALYSWLAGGADIHLAHREGDPHAIDR